MILILKSPSVNICKNYIKNIKPDPDLLKLDSVKIIIILRN